MRCNKCLRKITDGNPSSSLDRWGKPLCDNCGDCTHGVKLNQPCGKCEMVVRSQVEPTMDRDTRAAFYATCSFEDLLAKLNYELGVQERLARFGSAAAAQVQVSQERLDLLADALEGVGRR